jgi:1-acyl-sn-glycerol-3-phosphate acyltransferase
MTNLNTKLNSALRIALIALVFVPCTLFIVALQTASLLILNERTRSHWLQYTTQYWGFVAYAMLWLFSPVNICLTGQHHVLDMNTFAPIMSNHQLDTDWLFIWVVSYFRAAHGSVKIMLKAEVANIPVLAISFNFMKFISMTRKWEHDKDNMTAILSKAANTTLPLWFIIFPEGTLNWPGGIAKSKAYAEKMGIENHPKHCLVFSVFN